MEDLRNESVKMSFKSVKTFIQSGNVIFKTDSKEKVKLKLKLKKRLQPKLIK